MTPRERAAVFVDTGPISPMFSNVEVAIDQLTIEFEKAIEAERESCAKLVEECGRIIRGKINPVRMAETIRGRI